jgi:hypothetical protein
MIGAAGDNWSDKPGRKRAVRGDQRLNQALVRAAPDIVKPRLHIGRISVITMPSPKKNRLMTSVATQLNKSSDQGSRVLLSSSDTT